jgi:hypothetical protein
VRQRVLALPNVTLLRAAAYGLDVRDGRVTGVVTGDPDGPVNAGGSKAARSAISCSAG